MTKFPDIPTVDYQLAKKVYYSILIFTFIWLVLIFLAPLFMEFGGVFEKISSVMYIFFSKICHQNDNRSFHLLEYKLGVCSRCISIYAGFFFGTVFYPFKYKLNNIIPPAIWLLLSASIILLLDVIPDTSGVMPNTFLTRSVTGFFIGFVLPFYIIPGFVKFFYEIQSYLRKKISI